MVIKRKHLLELVREMPAQVEFDDVIYRLYLEKKLMAAEADVKAGRLVAHQQVQKEIRRWFR